MSLVLSAAMLLSLAACGGSASQPADTSADSGTSDAADADAGDAADAEAPSGDTAAAANDPAVTLVYAEMNPIGSFIGTVATAFKEKVEELSGGSVTIDIQAGGVLGAEEDLLDSIMSGSNQVDIARVSVFALNSYGVKKAVLCTLPFVFENREHFWNFANSDLAQEILNEPQELGLPVRGIFFGEEGFRHFFTRDPITGIEDLKGMKLRVSVDPIMTGMVENLGASPTVVSMTELYSGLQTGVCDGAEQPIANYASNAFNEVAPNLILDGHTLGAVQVLISDNAWNKLTENQQAAVMEAAAYAQQYNKEKIEATEQEILDQLIADGVNVIEVEDKTPWKEAVADIVEPYTTGELGELYDQLVAMK